MDKPIENAGMILKDDRAYEFHEFNNVQNLHAIFVLGGLEGVFARQKAYGNKISLVDKALSSYDLILANDYEVVDRKTGAILRDHTRALHKGAARFIGAEYLAGLAEHENDRHKDALREIHILEAMLPDGE